MKEPATPAPATPAPAPAFEVSLERLEKIVHELEGGSVSLEHSLQLFEEGMQLAEQCRRQLDAAENKIEMLVRKAGGKLAAEPFTRDDIQP